jgi:hypothetical protein
MAARAVCHGGLPFTARSRQPYGAQPPAKTAWPPPALLFERCQLARSGRLAVHARTYGSDQTRAAGQLLT